MRSTRSTDRLRRWQAASLLAAAPIATLAAADATAPVPPPAGAQRVADAVRVQQLRERVLAGNSATATLEAWCAEHGLAEQARVRAVRVHGQDKPAPEEVLRALGADAGTPLRYRRVQLACGHRVLSEADNWYLPEKLSPAMNRVLDSTDEPFGRVVGPLGFQRQTLGDRSHWPAQGNGDRAVVLEVRALLRDRSQQPFSYVIESYLMQALP